MTIKKGKERKSRTKPITGRDNDSHETETRVRQSLYRAIFEISPLVRLPFSTHAASTIITIKLGKIVFTLKGDLIFWKQYIIVSKI